MRFDIQASFVHNSLRWILGPAYARESINLEYLSFVIRQYRLTEPIAEVCKRYRDRLRTVEIEGHCIWAFVSLPNLGQGTRFTWTGLDIIDGDDDHLRFLLNPEDSPRLSSYHLLLFCATSRSEVLARLTVQLHSVNWCNRTTRPLWPLQQAARHLLLLLDHPHHSPQYNLTIFMEMRMLLSHLRAQTARLGWTLQTTLLLREGSPFSSRRWKNSETLKAT